jgi:tRNA dimethylallyltransferase
LDAKDKIPLVVIAGPTAVGKSGLAIALAEQVGGEIISGDSAQVYRGCDIGSAKVRGEEMRGVAHHLIDVVDPEDRFTVADFQQLAGAAIADIYRRGRLPILVGGTGLWLRAVVRGYRFPPQDDENPVRSHIAEVARRYGWDALRRTLQMVDPESFAKISAGDRRRVSRAMEVWWTTGNRLPRTADGSPYDVSYWVLFRPIAELHLRIGARVEQMLRDGLKEEVGGLLSRGVPRRAQSLSAIGYREMVDWYFGLSEEQVVGDLIRRHSEQLAKRQMTWFRSEDDVHWLDLGAWGDSRALGAIARDLVRFEGQRRNT